MGLHVCFSVDFYDVNSVLLYICHSCTVHCSDSPDDAASGNHSKTSTAKVTPQGPVPGGSGAELNEGVLASLGHLLTSGANSLGELLTMMPSASQRPSVSQRPCSIMATTNDDSRSVKRRRLSHQSHTVPHRLVTAVTEQLGCVSTDSKSSSASQVISNMTDPRPTAALGHCSTG